jgi:hypothetical protein
MAADNLQQELYKHVQNEAQRLNLASKARDFRLPYWDWAMDASSSSVRFPDLFFDDKMIKIKIEPGREIVNPLGVLTSSSIPGGKQAAGNVCTPAQCTLVDGQNG